MARPIEPTPILTGKDAERLRKEVENTKTPSIEALEVLERCREQYRQFYNIKD